MATQAEIQGLINQIVTNANYKANQLRPLLTSMLDFASAGQTLVFDGLVANNTTMEDTTLVLDYGVNIIETSTLTNFACKLPIPVTGKRVIVVNKSLFQVSLFPSMAGGQINNYAIDAPAIIPPDGNAYDFICIENPLPGAWIWSPPAIGQFDSGEITATTTGNTNTYNIAAASSLGGPTFAAERSGQLAASGVENALNRAFIFEPNAPVAFPNISYLPVFKPVSYWNTITKIKVYTNIVTSVGVNPSFLLTAAAGYNTYAAGTQTFIDQGEGLAENPFVNSFSLTNVIAGTLPSPGLTANVGDPGTRWGEIVLTPTSFVGPFNTVPFVGDKLISTDGVEDIWFTRYLTAFLVPRTTGAVKFRFFIEFN